MNEACLAMSSRLGIAHVGDMLAAPGLRCEANAEHLPVTAEYLVSSVASIAEKLVVAAIERKTALQFIAARENLFPQYFVAVRALSDLARIVVPRHSLDVITAHSFSESEAEFRDHGLSAFGSEVRDQAMFTVWTLRKISDLCQRIDEMGPSPELGEADGELDRQFVFYALFSRFHLDCLLKSMQTHKSLYPEVLEVAIEGLRGAVNAYTWVRQKYNLRVPKAPPPGVDLEWDDEDKELLREANRELIVDPQ